MAAKTLGSAAGGLFSRTSLPAKQQSLAARIGRYADMDDDAFFQEMEEFENLIEESRGFRHLAPTTQARQDSILASCLAMVRHMNRLPDNFDDEATEALAFPNDKNKLLRQVQHYLISIYKSSHGRGANVNHRMRYETFVQYREALLFWIRYKFDLRNMEPPHQSWMFNNISMTMRLVQSKFGIQDRRDVKEGLGLVELRQLLEHEMTTNLSVKVSEHHQLIWCIGRQTAVRPGSIGWSKGRKDRYLRWADVGFRNLGDGKFTCILKIKHLKTNYQNPERGTHRQLNFTIASPNAENLIFSVPHRLLVIALRRSLLVGIESLEDLLKSQNAYILIKDANLDDPVFYRSLPAGRGLDMSPGHNKTQALSASAISCYLADRGRALGYTEPVSMYSIRHRTATDLAVRVGHATAREIMGHDPGTYTLERYYLNVLPLVDLAGATLDQRISPNGISAEALTEYAPLAQTALSSAKMQQIQGVALRNFVEEICSKDPAFPVNGDTNTRRLYLKRARAYALRTLVNEAHQESVRTVTVNEIEARQKSWTHDAAMFAKRIQEAATAFASASSAQRQMMVPADLDDDTHDANYEIWRLQDEVQRPEQIQSSFGNFYLRPQHRPGAFRAHGSGRLG
ncbi:hypothetical protein KVT40_002993 [Elsinoe batatas]|uniref:Uncharacterized protein n=1 Tax=Elsinoe batatas TaxID=2601811 RepID=A0A8K0PJ35_9PEZI|nr:hypothetical protein KVT40_002993 [Elsinoe batatas]